MKRFLTTTAILLAAATAQANELTVGVANMSSYLEPGTDHSNVGSQYYVNTFETLLGKDAFSSKAKFEPMLATSWELLGPRRARLTIREGVKFHNGDEMTIEDVLFSFQAMMNVTHPARVERSREMFSNIARVEQVDATTIEIITKQPEPLMELLLNQQNGMILPKKYLMGLTGDPNVDETSDYIAFGLAPVGTGPYKITEFTPSESLVWERFDDYWGEPAPYERVTVRFIPELSARVTALVNGEVDLVTNIPPDQLPVIDNTPGFKTEGAVTPLFHVVFFGTGERNPKVTPELRKAMMLAVDRDLLNEALWEGKAVVPSTHTYPQFGDFYTPDIITFRHDLDEAKKIVAENNLEGTELLFHTHPVYYTNGVLAAQAMQEMWAEIGINVSLNVAIERPNASIREVANWSNPMYFADPHGSFGKMWAPTGAGISRGFWEPSIGIEEYTKLYDAFRYETDVEKRNAAFARVMEEVERDAPFFIKYQPYESWGMRADLDWAPFPGHIPYVLDFRAGYIGDEKNGINK